MPRWNRVQRIVLQPALLFVLVHAEEVFNTTPPSVRTNFSCAGRSTGFYADVEANCRVYHTCDDFGNKFSYHCPEETAFRQDALICDHAHLVDCRSTEYSGQRVGNEKREDAAVTSPFNGRSLGSLGNNRRSFTRSFQVIQRPNKSAVSNKPGFVFSASVFLRDLDEPESRKLQPPLRDDPVRAQPTRPTSEACNVNRMHIKTDSPVSPVPTSLRPPFEPVSSKLETRPRQEVSAGGKEGSWRRDKVQIETSSYKDSAEQHRSALFDSRKEDVPRLGTVGKDPTVPEELRASTAGYRSTARNFPPARDSPKLPYGNRDYPYLETLRSIQANARPSTATATTTPRTATTTEVPVHALTLSLKPLVPNELEYDPYYPRVSTSTEAYYTPGYGRERLNYRTSTQASFSSVRFEIPAVLPDLNTLEDLVDRRKLFYIPRVKPA